MDIIKLVEEKNNKLKILGNKEMYCIIDGKAYIKIDCASVKNLVIPEFVYGIKNLYNGNQMSYSDDVIESISFGENIQHICSGSFYYLKKLNKISDMNNVVLIEFDYLFCGCKSLELAPKINTKLNEKCKSMNYTFYKCSSLKETPIIPNGIEDLESIFSCCTSIVNPPIIPDSVKSINYAFNSCKSLISPPILPDSLIKMEKSFRGCKLLTKAPIIPKLVIDMSEAFRECESLIESQIIPNCVKYLDNAFECCINLIEAPIIPESVTDIDYIFCKCKSLTGSLVVNTNLIGGGKGEIYGCLDEASTNKDTKLKVSGSSELIDKIIDTKSHNSNIVKVK